MNTQTTRRFNLTLPTPIIAELEKVAQEYQISIVDVLRSFIRIGLMVVRAQNDPNKAVMIREGDRISEIFFTPPL